MNVLNLAHERQFFLWSVIGPLLALATVLLMLFSPTPLTSLFALTLFLGLPACWYLKKNGIILAAFALTFLIFFNTDAFAEAPLWHSGITLSVLLTLFISNQSFEEAEMLVGEFSGHSASIQKTIEQYKSDNESLKFKYQTEQEAVQAKLTELSQELQSVREKNQEKYTELQDTVEKAKSDAHFAKEERDQAKNEVKILRGELEAQAIKEEHVLQELLDKRKEVFQLREQLQELQDDLKNRPVEIVSAQDEVELRHLHDLVNKKEQDLFNMQFRLDSALEDIRKQEIELVKFQDNESVQKKMQLEMSDKIDALKREKELLEITASKLQHETQQILILKQEIERLENSLQSALQELENARAAEAQEAAAKPVEESSGQNWALENSLRRRAEGMYLQLKEQFNEKSLILDDTRRELFHTQENLLRLQRSLREVEQFGPHPQVHSLTQYILKMQNYFERREKNYQSEIDTLHEIITRIQEMGDRR